MYTRVLASLACLLSVGCGGPVHPFKWSWKLADATDPAGPALSCSSVDVAYLGLAFRGTQGITPFQWPCTPQGQVITDPLPDDNYAIASAALDTGMKVVSAGPTLSASNRGQGQDLGQTVFTF